MQRTLYNHVIPHIMAQSRAESRQRCVTIIGCVHDHNCGTIRSCVTITSCVTLTNCVFVDLNREVVVIHPESFGIVWCVFDLHLPPAGNELLTHRLTLHVLVRSAALDVRHIRVGSAARAAGHTGTY